MVESVFWFTRYPAQLPVPVAEAFVSRTGVNRTLPELMEQKTLGMLVNNPSGKFADTGGVLYPPPSDTVAAEVVEVTPQHSATPLAYFL